MEQCRVFIIGFMTDTKRKKKKCKGEKESDRKDEKNSEIQERKYFFYVKLNLHKCNKVINYNFKT